MHALADWDIFVYSSGPFSLSRVGWVGWVGVGLFITQRPPMALKLQDVKSK